MAFTRRERIIVIITALAVVLLVVDRYCLSPLIEQYSQTKQNREKLETELQKSLAAIERGTLLQKQWNQMKESGLSDNYEGMESSILRYLKDSSMANKMDLSSIQPQIITSSNDAQETEFAVSASGNMASVIKFLWDIETAKLPVKIKNLQLGSNDESAQRISIQVKLSSIYLDSQHKKLEEK